MATMVKEKSKDKKKNKDKHKLKNIIEQEVHVDDANILTPESNVALEEIPTATEAANVNDCVVITDNINSEETLDVDTEDKIDNIESKEDNSEKELTRENEIVVPSAPTFEVNEPVPYIPIEKVQEVPKIKVKCMPLEEAIRLFGGKEIAEVRAISEAEEAIVEAGPRCKPDHPLVDLLSTLRTSLIAVDRERNRISCRYIEEEKSRVTLWKVDKRTINISEKCACGTNVNLRASFDVAKLDREKLSTARLRLQALLQDVQDSYCHHQHTALHTHCEIDEVINETIKKEKEYIREALALVFEALRFSDGAPAAYAQALQRWASVLSAALLDEENFNHLLFVLHNLFRQTRSVQWAEQVLNVQAKDMSSAARLVGLLDLLLTRPVLESAQECTEDKEEWEELDDRGEGCAVGEGRLRERDLLALLRALPLKDMLARIVLFSRQDIKEESEEWWGDRSGGRRALQACCGARAALHVLLRARAALAGYARLRGRLRALGCAALDALAALHAHSRSSYTKDLEDKITAELEACFAAGFTLLEDEAHRLPAALLSDDVVQDYCSALVAGLHEKSVQIASLSVEARPQTCAVRARIVAHAALSRPLDRDLARLVLNFLFQTGIHRKPPCKGGCDVTARELLPQLLAVHPHVHTVAFHLLAESNQTETDGSILESLLLQHWRPTPNEIVGVLDDWAIRCPQLLQHLLLNLDYTPHTGVSLDSQVRAGEWLCEWVARRGAEPEWAWRALRALRVHRAYWRPPPAAPACPPPCPPPHRPLHAALALLAGDWGHSVPLICGPGADALLQLAQSRPIDALHCAGLVMRVMAQSPESISLTPKFTEIFATILNSGPSLVQRALGQRGGSGPELLQKLLLEQLRDPDTAPAERSALLSGWLHALWTPALPASARAALDAAVRAARDWRALDAHAHLLLQEENAKEYLADTVRNAAVAPLLCESALRVAHGAELSAPAHARLHAELARQRAAGQRVHVNNALKQIGWSVSDGDLSLSRCACAVLSARAQHPAHALLWRLLLHVWLQRISDTSPPIGPLLFSGIVKSRTLAQLKKRLQETAVYHHDQIDILKSRCSDPSSAVPQNKLIKSNSTTDNGLFQTESIFNDLTGESNESESTPSDVDGKIDDISESETQDDRDVLNLISYHTAVEKMLREYLLWLEEGENVRARPYHADISRFLSEQALDAAWRASLEPTSPSPSPTSPATPPAPPPSVASPPTPLPPAHLTHFERAVAAVQSIDSVPRKRFRIPAPLSTISESVLKDPFLLLQMIEQYIDKLKNLNEEWQSEWGRACALDQQLWQLVERLRVRRALPPVRGACPQRCAPLVVHVPEEEWCISTGAEQALRENSRVSSAQCAVRAAELAWRAAPHVDAYAPARDALAALVADVAQRWLNGDAALTCSLLARWGGGGGGAAQLCGALVRPARLPPAHWPRLYAAVLALPLPPHAIFSYLTKFDMSYWADAVDTCYRSELLEMLVKAATRIGPKPTEEDMVLIEILGVHSAAVARPRELRAHVLRCWRACAAGSLPAAYVAHVPRLARRPTDLLLDELGRLLQELGFVWWEARAAAGTIALAVARELYAEYVAHVTDALYSLCKQFVAAAVRSTYTPERVAYCSWTALESSWSPWVAPHSTPPLLPAGDHYEDMISRFVDAVQMIMDDCPGSSEAVLRQVWQWAARAALGGGRLPGVLPARLAALPWRLHWLAADCVPLALQLCGVADQETRSWFGECLRHAPAAAWLRGVPDDQLAPALANLLALFTAAQSIVPADALEEACHLPWQRLPLIALDAALERYFAEHHNPALPYHQLPHFKVVLVASQLVAGDTGGGGGGGDKRALCVSQWARVTAAPALAPHVAAHTRHLLHTLADLAPHVHADELVQLLSRALAVLCVQPADALALPVWEQWVRGCSRTARRAAAAALASLTALDSFAALADALARAVMSEPEPADWSELLAAWAAGAGGAWRAPELVTRARLHAAYAALLARAHSHPELRRAFRSLLALDIDFVQNEVIVAVWICVACRVGAEGGAVGADGAGGAARDECAEAARALLTNWAERRRSLLQVVTLQSAANCPTALHQLLCRLALCAGCGGGSAGGEGARRAYEAARGACPAAGGAAFAADAVRPRSAPRLAARLFADREHYFAHELLLAPDTD
ncbi:unnamed protein product [Euphydryas editha]|uniref:Ectopic P granules protein 5 homolog n=1 Tax=Euphydryas editha TaxID=104508 RepID=A0AAU9TJX3_EUPED|nr:unnamed protein product [Euphydryas editha]